MRFKNTKGKYQLYAVTGTHAISFAIDCADTDMKNLLGFTVEKEYKKGNDKMRVTVMGFKVFKERIANPVAGALYSSYDNPIQAFTWDDFTAYPDTEYTYYFTPLKGNPSNIERGTTSAIKVKTEPAWSAEDHNVFFNRGVASSQAYAVKFGNKAPSKIGEEAYKWLSRGLEEAIIAFIGNAKKGDTLYGCFYEFHYDEVLLALKSAAQRGVTVNIIYDAKDNEHYDKKAKKQVESFPKVENGKAIKRTKLNKEENVSLFPRETNKSYLSHNKFMVLEKSEAEKYVWTGSTNISEGGIFGQANVGHAIKSIEAAEKYLAYWKILQTDPEGKNLKKSTVEIQEDITLEDIPDGITCFFSPRSDSGMLEFYADLLDSAKHCGCITLAFGANEKFVTKLSDNNSESPLTFLLLEKDAPDISDYVYKSNVVKAVGSYIGNDELTKWVGETNTLGLKINKHVMYIHTKFLLRDPLSEVPVVVTGSANFSKAATETNDENMMVIKGNRRVADIYFTEFMRLFNHYYFRWIINKLSKAGTLADSPAFLDPSHQWTDKYKEGKYKRKRVELFTTMFGAAENP
ncbi:MAG TPA: phospholipase D-like domain-containing protein [Cyclobacteriaceae bacterium]|nr:phospholipase D-like domain-containing protein [Cyclobacteriaceae bacterium]